MIQFTKGNLLSSSSAALVNTVNTVGVMGKGIALQFKDEFPHNYEVYSEACRKGELFPGKLLVVKDSSFHYGEKWIVNFPTKVHWKNPSRYEYIESGLIELRRIILEYGFESISIPPLGCGNGGLEWDKVKGLIVRYLSDTSILVLVYEPNQMINKILISEAVPMGEIKLTPARAMLLYALFQYETLGEPSSLFVANKLVYFMQRLGEPTFRRFSFTQSHFGPYCHQVGKALHQLNGKYVKGLEQMSLGAFEPLTLQYDTWEEVSRYVETQLTEASRNRLEMLSELIRGFQSSLSLEVLATVDFVRKQNPGIDLQETIQKVWEWNERKRFLFKERYIQIAYDRLEERASQYLGGVLQQEMPDTETMGIEEARAMTIASVREEYAKKP